VLLISVVNRICQLPNPSNITGRSLGITSANVEGSSQRNA